MGRNPVTVSPIRGPIFRDPDQWVADVWFTGKKTGKVLHRRMGAMPSLSHDDVMWRVRMHYKLFDWSRVVDLKIRRRRDADAEAGKVVTYGNGNGIGNV